MGKNLQKAREATMPGIFQPGSRLRKDHFVLSFSSTIINGW